MGFFTQLVNFCERLILTTIPFALDYVGKPEENLIKIDFGQKFLKKRIFHARPPDGLSDPLAARGQNFSTGVSLGRGHLSGSDFWGLPGRRCGHSHFLMPELTLITSIFGQFSKRRCFFFNKTQNFL